MARYCSCKFCVILLLDARVYQPLLISLTTKTKSEDTRSSSNNHGISKAGKDARTINNPVNLNKPKGQNNEEYRNSDRRAGGVGRSERSMEARLMTTEITEPKVKFIVDKRGRRTHAVVPLKEYEELLEDLHDLALGLSRLNEEDIPMEEAFKRLESDETV